MSRVSQFWRAVFAGKRLGDDEVRWVQKYLSPPEEALFWQMSPIDQKHAVDVSQRIVSIARHRGVWDGAEIRMLIRAALLHDIGKIDGDIGLFDRITIVLVKRLAPSLAKALAQRGKEDLERKGVRRTWRAGVRRAFYTQAVHAERGAAMAKLVGVEDQVLHLIRHHHHPQRGDRLLEVFAEADR